MNHKPVVSCSNFSEALSHSAEASMGSVVAKFSLNKFVSGLSQKTSFVQDKLLPGWGDSKIDKLLFKPNNSTKTANRTPKGFREENINTKDGKVRAYLTGSGPMVVFVHGWGGSAYQFLPLMRGLARCGFSSLAFDHLGHGQSSASQRQSINLSQPPTMYFSMFAKTPTMGLPQLLAIPPAVFLSSILAKH